MRAHRLSRRRLWATLGLVAALMLPGCQADRPTPAQPATLVPPTPLPPPTATAAAAATPTPQPTPTPPRSAHIADLLAQGEIAVRARGAGIEELELDLQDLVEEILDVEVPAGTYFVSGSSSVQDMVARSTTVIRLEGNDWLSTLVDVACAAMERDVPDEEDSFTVERSPRQEELSRLMPVLESAQVDYDVEQAAVWIVTDDADYGELGRLRAGLMGRVIGPDEAARAMQIVDQAGVDIMQKAIWSDREDLQASVEDRSLWAWLRDRDPGAAAQGEVWEASAGMTLPQMGPLVDFAFSPDGTFLATSVCTEGSILDCSRGEIALWDAVDILDQSVVDPAVSVPTDLLYNVLAFSPDGSVLASAACTDYRPPNCLASEIWLWDVPSMAAPQIVAGPEARVSELSFAPDGNLLLVAFCTLRGSLGCQDWQVQLWDRATGSVQRTLGDVDSAGLRFTPDGGQIVGKGCVARQDRLCTESEIRFWDVGTGEVIRRLSPDMRLITDLALSPNRQYLAVIGRRLDAETRPYALLVFELATERVVGQITLADEENWCANLAMAPDGSLVASAACDREADTQTDAVRLWHMPSAKLATTIPIQPEGFLRVAFSPDGETLAIFGFDRDVLSLEPLENR